MKTKVLGTLLAASVAFIAGSCNDANKKDDKNLLESKMVSNPYTADGVDTAVMNRLATMDFADTLHDFGRMKEGEVAEYDFTFKNNGKQPLLISKASGSCGCTVPDYPREPIVPGGTGVVKVKFNSAGKYGFQDKSVTLLTNSTHGMHTLYIKAEVEGTPESTESH